MIGRLHRFHGHNSLRGVYQRGQAVRNGSLALKFVDRGGGRSYRVAVVVSRKVHKSAVVRNRIRRRIYEQVRQADLQELATADLVFTVFNDQLAVLPAEQLQSSVQDLLSKAKKAGQNRRSEPRHVL